MLKRFEAVLSRLPGNHRLPNRKILPQQKCPDVEKILLDGRIWTAAGCSFPEQLHPVRVYLYPDAEG